MYVKDLQQFLLSLSSPMSTSGAKKAADELTRMCSGLDPFASLSIAQFSEFLATAETYARTGLVPTSGRRKAAGTRRAAKKVDPEAIQAAVEQLQAFSDRVVQPDVDYTTIAAEMKKLDKQFTKDAILQIARDSGISGTFKTKKAAIDEIRRRLEERKESHDRTQF